MRKIFAILLFLYAGWQVLTCFAAPNQGQGLGQLIWAILAIAGGVYLWKRAKK